MAKVHPQARLVGAPSTTSSKQEVFTLWMKSLILSSNGCAVFDSSGRVVYRVDNYEQKRVKRAHIMDSTGKILFTIVKKKFSMLGLWEGYRSRDGVGVDKAKPGFRVRRVFGIGMIFGLILGGYSSYYKVAVESGEVNKAACCDYYIMETQISKGSCRIIDTLGGGLVAEVKRKISGTGVVYGDDVLTMVVEPNVDQSLIMGLVVVFGLIHHKL